MLIYWAKIYAVNSISADSDVIPMIQCIPNFNGKIKVKSCQRGAASLLLTVALLHILQGCNPEV